MSKAISLLWSRGNADVALGSVAPRAEPSRAEETTAPLVVDTGRAARSVLWSVAENGGLALISFAALIIYSRFLSAAEFGVFSIALAVVELLGLLVSMPFHDALVQKRNVTRLHFDTAFSVTVAVSLCLLAGCVLFAPAFTALVGHAGAAPVLAALAFCFPFTALSATLVAQHRRELDFRALALRSLVGRVAGAVLGITLVALGAGLWGLVAQQVLIALTGSLVLWFKADSLPRLRFGRRELGELFGFGLYALGAILLTFAVKRVFVIVAGVMLGSESAGYLNLSFRAVDVLWAIAATSVTQVALPVLSRLQADRVRLKAAYRTASEFACLALYPCFIGLAVVAPEAIELLFGARWLPSAPYVTVLGLLVVSQAARLLVTPTLSALGRPRDALIGVALELTAILALIAALGAHSLELAASIWILRELVAAPVMFTLLRRATGFSLRDELGAILVPLMASGAMALVVLGLRRALPLELTPLARLACLVPAGTLTFLLGMYSFGRGSLQRAVDFAASARGAKAAGGEHAG
jgi:PST family polysaccharide transporter